MPTPTRPASELLDAIVGSAPLAIVAVDNERRIRLWNPAAEELFGWRRQDILGEPLSVLIPDEEATESRRLFERMRDGHTVQLLETERRHKDGHLIPVRLTTGPIVDEAGTIVGSVAFVTDDRERRREESARREYERRYRRIFEHSNDAIFLIDPARERILDGNPTACTLLGYAIDELRSLSPHDIHPDEMPELRAFFATVLNEGQGRSDTFSCRTRDGELVPCEISASRLELDAERYVLAMVRDIRQRRRAEDALRRTAERLEDRARELERANADLTQIAHGIHHDLSEPLRTVTYLLQLVRDPAADDAEVREFAELAGDAVGRVRALLDGLISFARAGTSDLPREDVDCEELVAEVIGSLRPRLDEVGAEISVGPLPTVRAVRGGLAQLLQNLITNAVKFRREGVTPRVGITARRDGDTWHFEITDNGTGIGPELREGIFDMFRRGSSPRSGGGSGIGLAICRRVVRNHGGRIWVESSPGSGSAFHFTLPVEPPPR